MVLARPKADLVIPIVVRRYYSTEIKIPPLLWYTFMMSRFNPGVFFVGLAALLWSFDGLLRRSLYTLPPQVIVFYEHVFGSIILLFCLPKILPEIRKMGRREWVAIAVVSLVSGLLGTLFYTAALGRVQYIQFSVVVLLQQLQPLWAITAASILLREKITKEFALWAGLALFAAYLISFQNLNVNIVQNLATAQAAGLALLAGVFWGSSTAVSKYVLQKVSFLTATALRFFFTALFGLVFVLATGGFSTNLSQPQWGTLALITLTTGMVALGIYYYGLKKVPARVATLCELVWPASAIFIDYFYFQKGLSATQILGVALLIFVLYKVSKIKK
jgi:drug/metabolite transporter (DMT)-like permease